MADNAPVPPLLYIHGFASSGHSHKGQVLATHFPQAFRPSLSHIPALAVETLEILLDALSEPPVLVGSSLGGLYAYYLSAVRGLPAVLINPVVPGAAALGGLPGLHRHYYDGSRFEFTSGHLEALRGYDVVHPHPDRLLVLLQTGDEVLDHGETIRRLSDARLEVEAGGSHAYEGFADRLVRIRAFAAEWASRRPLS